MHSLAINTANGPLAYTIAHRPRVTKRLHLEMDASGGLVIVAPGHWSRTYIRATMVQNATRITRFVERTRQRQLKPLEYIDGGQHLYLGESCQLVVSAPGFKDAIVTENNKEIRISVRQIDEGSVKSALQGWYRRQALKVFTERLAVFKQKRTWARDKTIHLKLRRMKRTWGNCSSTGVIKLNTHLIKAPMPVIDSVIAHELCHLQEMNHGNAFYALLESLNPNWCRDRVFLRSSGYIYLQV